MEPIALTVPEAVRVSGLSRSSLYILLRDGEIEAKKAGRKTLIPAEALQRYIESLPAAYESAA